VSSRIWTVQEATDWYKKYYINQPIRERPLVSPLYYRGTNNEFHYFICRSIDEWVYIKIDINQLKLKDIQPVWDYETSKNLDSSSNYGYYQVDPINNFERVKK
jgi:hypothetical protein